jgi:hypothetical protein
MLNFGVAVVDLAAPVATVVANAKLPPVGASPVAPNMLTTCSPDARASGPTSALLPSHDGHAQHRQKIER